MPIDYPYLSYLLVKESANDPLLLTSIWGKEWGMDNPVGTIRQVLVNHPNQAISKLAGRYEFIESGPLLLNQIKGKLAGGEKPAPPDFALVQSQHKDLVTALKKEGIEVVFIEGSTDQWPESIFTRDMALIVPGGCILSRFALYVRYGESRLAAQTLQHLGMPILGSVQGTGTVEGGSFIMLDPKTALIGRSERVNHEGIEQVRQILSWQQIDLITIDLPASIIHLDEAFLMIDERKALVNISLLPFWFLDELHRRKIEMLHVDPRDPMLAINALALSPGKVLIANDAPYTMELLSRQGIQLVSVNISEIQKLGGGIHCCTLPLIRDPLN